MTKLFQLATNNLIGFGLIGVGIIGVSFWRLWPVFSTHLPSAGDGVLISYLISWTGQSLSTGQNPWQVPFFHPYLNTLTFSDPFLATGLLTLPLQLLTSNLVLIHNAWLIVSSLCMWWLMVWLLKLEKTRSTAAVLAATTFVIAPWHWHYTVHLHTFNQISLVLAVCGLIKWKQSGQSKWLWLTAGAWIGQLLDSALSAYWIAAVLVILTLHKSWWSQLSRQRTTILRCLLLTGGIAILCYLPFFETSRLYHYTRSIRDAAHFAHSIDRIVSWDLGGVGLLCLSLIWRYRSSGLRTRSKPDHHSVVSDYSLLAIILLGVILMLGPALKAHGTTFKFFDFPIPLPYALAYYLLPGFQAFRASSRWIIVAGFGLSWLLGRYWSRVKMPTALSVGGAMALCTLWWWLGPRTWQLHRIPISTPEIYVQAANTTGKNLAEFPVYVWSMDPYVINETNRLLYQPVHQKNLYNGASGFTPPQAIDDWTRLWQTFPDDESVALLQQAQIDHIIVHFDEYQQMSDNRYSFAGTPAPTFPELQTRIMQQPHLRLLDCREQACLYTIHTDETTTQN